MLEFIKSFEFVSTIALFVYWMPLMICSVVYFFRAVAMYKRDLKDRENERFYHPSLTIGTIVWFIIWSITPCVNLISMVFDCASSIFIWLGRVLDVPLVPRKK